MQAKELTDILADMPEARVRMSIEGERPLLVRAVALIDGEVVLMAVPSWNFSELSDALADLSVAVTARGVAWLDVFAETGIDGPKWQCKEHGLSPDGCNECRVKTIGGWHQGAGTSSEKRFCNCHSKSTCPAQVPDLEG